MSNPTNTTMHIAAVVILVCVYLTVVLIARTPNSLLDRQVSSTSIK